MNVDPSLLAPKVAAEDISMDVLRSCVDTRRLGPASLSIEMYFSSGESSHVRNAITQLREIDDTDPEDYFRARGYLAIMPLIIPRGQRRLANRGEVEATWQTIDDELYDMNKIISSMKDVSGSKQRGLLNRLIGFAAEFGTEQLSVISALEVGTVPLQLSSQREDDPFYGDVQKRFGKDTHDLNQPNLVTPSRRRRLNVKSGMTNLLNDRHTAIKFSIIDAAIRASREAHEAQGTYVRSPDIFDIIGILVSSARHLQRYRLAPQIRSLMARTLRETIQASTPDID